MKLIATGNAILNQLMQLSQQLSDSEYSAELGLLHGNSIGKHVRHVLEFFDILVVLTGKTCDGYTFSIKQKVTT